MPGARGAVLLGVMLACAAPCFGHGDKIPANQVPEKWRPAVADLCRAWQRLDLDANHPALLAVEAFFSSRTVTALRQTPGQGCREMSHPGTNDEALDLYAANLLRCSQSEAARFLLRRQERAGVPVSFRLHCAGTYDEFFHNPGDVMNNMIQPDFHLEVFEGETPKGTHEGFFHIHFDDAVNPSKIYSMSLYIPAAVAEPDAAPAPPAAHHH